MFLKTFLVNSGLDIDWKCRSSLGGIIADECRKQGYKIIKKRRKRSKENFYEEEFLKKTETQKLIISFLQRKNE